MHLPIWFDQPAFAEKYNAIGRPFIRFPGGTPSNFYNPQTGLFDNDSPSDREYGSQNKKLLKITDGAGLTPEPFFQFAKEQNLRYSLVLNVCTQSYEQNVAWLEQLAEEGNKIPAIEIGNEVFFGGYQWAFPKPADYLDRSRKLTTIIRRLFPDTKVGLVFPNQFYQDGDLFNQGDRENPNSLYKWMTMLEGETFYDALIVHLYSMIGMTNATEPEDFIPHIDAYSTAMAMLEDRFAPTFEQLKQRFPDKDLWVTEYGVGGFGGKLKQYTLRYSHLGSLHADVMWLRFIQNPSVTIADWHSFNHFFDTNPEKTQFTDHEHISYTHFSMFRDPIRNSTEVVPVEIGVVGEDQDIEVVAFRGKEKGHLLVINKYGEEHTLGSISIRSSDVSSTANVRAGIQLIHRTDMPLEQAMQATDRCERVTLSGEKLQSVTLPPYSTTQLEIEVP